MKRAPDGDTVYHYDPEGRLIAESALDGSHLKEYVWLNDLPVAVLVGGAK